MSEATAWFPMSQADAAAVQMRCAEAYGLPVEARLELAVGEEIELRLIPAGEFLMGTRVDDPTHRPERGPQHRVEFREPFYLSRFPVTQAQWQTVAGTNPAYFPDRADSPVENVTWEACVAFCQQVTAMTGRPVRLPSEAEWEYACRAGSDMTYSFGDSAGELDQYGWYRENSGMISQPVGCKVPNAWGLHDMHGGIDEFVQDHAHPDYVGAPTDGSAWITGGEEEYRILRGGSWYDLAEHCESAHRNAYRLDAPSEDHGFRIVVEVDSRSIT